MSEKQGNVRLHLFPPSYPSVGGVPPQVPEWTTSGTAGSGSFPSGTWGGTPPTLGYYGGKGAVGHYPILLLYTVVTCDFLRLQKHLPLA